MILVPGRRRRGRRGAVGVRGPVRESLPGCTAAAPRVEHGGSVGGGRRELVGGAAAEGGGRVRRRPEEGKSCLNGEAHMAVAAVAVDGRKEGRGYLDLN